MASAGLSPHSEDAYLRLAIPTEFSDMMIQQLFQTGHERFTTDGEADEDKLIASIERFALNAFDWADGVLDDGDLLAYDRPAELPLLATYAAVIVKSHSYYADAVAEGEEYRIQLLEDIREYYAENVILLIARHDPAFRMDVVKETANTLYQKEPDEEMPYPGNPVRDIVTPGGSDRTHLKIPMVAAKPDFVEYEHDLEHAEDLDVQFRDNALLVPVTAMQERWVEYGKQAFDRMLRAQERELADAEIEWLQQNESRITERIDRWLEDNRKNRLWADFDPDGQTLYAIRDAVTSYYEIDEDQFFTAGEILTAVNHYTPTNDWLKDRFREFTSPQSLVSFFDECETGVRVRETPEWESNEYAVTHSFSAEELVVDELADLFELPCMTNMMNEFQKRGGPTHDGLLNLAATAMFLPKYYRSTKPLEEKIDMDALKADFNELLGEFFPKWHDSSITNYHLNWLKNNDIARERDPDPTKGRYLPKGCSHDDMDEYCIGYNKCPYDIYASLPFVDYVYDHQEQMAGDDDDYRS